MSATGNLTFTAYEYQAAIDRAEAAESQLAFANAERERLTAHARAHYAMRVKAEEERDRLAKRLDAREEELLADNTKQVLERRRQDRRGHVLQFFHIAGQAIPRTPAVPDEETLRFRARLFAEEAVELLGAMFDTYKPEPWRLERIREDIMSFVAVAPVSQNLPAIVAESVDVDFVVEGLRIACGVDSTPIWEAIAEANAKKAGGPIVNSKLTKPPGWKPAPVAELLAAQGWRR